MRSLFALALAAALCVPAAMASSVNLSTGVPPVDGGGGAYTYAYTVGAPGSPLYLIITHGNAVRTGPNAAWMKAPGDIHWISNTGTGGTTNQFKGYWIYTTTFDTLNGRGLLSGWFASDNNMYEVILNGQVLPGISTSGAGTFDYQTFFSVNSGFVKGNNTLEFVVYNNASGPEGLLANVLFTPTPEPSAILLLGTGFFALALFSRRRATRHNSFASEASRATLDAGAVRL